MLNISDLVTVSQAALSAGERPPDDILVLMLPVVGISVVLFSLGILAFVLSQFIWIERLISIKDKLFLKKEAKEEKKQSQTEQKVPEEIPEQVEINDDEMAAVFTALHLFIQDKSSDPVILTEHLVENSGWVNSSKARQNAIFNKWYLSKKR